MRGAKKLVLKDSLVIVCEGSETENRYFEEIADSVRSHQPERYSKIRVVPTQGEFLAMNKIRHSLKNGKRVMKQGSSHPEWLYFVKEDHSQIEYEKYREFPVRLVREAQLFLMDDGYTEAWAVYDKDIHTGHQNARLLAGQNPKVGIAFSSYSFEEWILCHFERLSKSFSGSLCKDKECGSIQGCCGQMCLIGRLRAMNHITDYKKNMVNLFSQHLCHRIPRACFNAAWLRNLDKEPIVWLRNPYTDVDRFVMHLLGNGEYYEWTTLNKEFSFENTRLKVSSLQNSLEFRIFDNHRLLLSSKRLSYCNETGQPVAPVIGSNVLLDVGCPTHLAPIDKTRRYLRLDEDIKYKPRKVFFIELPFYC